MNSPSNIFILVILILLIITIIAVIYIEISAKKKGYKSDSQYRKTKRKRYSKNDADPATLKRFNNYYSEVSTKYKQFMDEKLQNKAKGHSFKIAAAIVLIISIPFCRFRKRPIENIDILFNSIFVTGVIIFYIILAIGTKKKRDYRSFYKTKIIPPLINSINPEYIYHHNFEKNPELEKEIFQNLKSTPFYKNDYKKMFADDYISGPLSDGTTFTISDISLLTSSISHRFRHKTIIYRHEFDGIFAYYNLKKSIDCEIIVKSSDIKKELHSVTRNTNDFPKSNLVLTQDLIDFLIDFYDKYNLDFTIYFKNDKVFFLFDTDIMFEPNMYVDGIYEDDLFDYYYELLAIIEFMDNVKGSIQ